jgi:hypothetical protein
MTLTELKFCTSCNDFKLQLDFNRNQNICRTCQAAIWAARKQSQERTP